MPGEQVAALLDTIRTHYPELERRLDWHRVALWEDAGGKGETTVGIYKVEGDTLTICMVESDKEADRPKEFKTSKDSKAMILTLQRVKGK